jgi:hypothetical protein
MPEERETLGSERVSTGRTIYFLDARQAVNGRYYITLTESRRSPDGSFDQKRLMVFEEALSGFSDAVVSMAGLVSGLVSRRKACEVDDVRRLHPRAFMKWDEDEESRLASLFSGGASPEEIATSLGRTHQAVNARLEKLGFLPGQPASEDTAGH